MNRYALDQVATWLGIQGAPALPIRQFQQNSALVAPGDLFFALKGERSDGHAYLAEVAEKGACAAVVAKGYAGVHEGMLLLFVDDVLDALHAVAKAAYALRPRRVVGVTGSAGKTTTKEFIADLLSAEFSVARTPGNMNSQVGVPLFILNTLGDEEVCVVEMSMSEPGNILKLIDLIPPEVALVTKIALAHAAFFPEGLPAIAQAKAEIFHCAQTKRGFVSAQAAEFDEVMGSGSCSKGIYGWEGEGGEKEYVLRTLGGKFQIVERGEETEWFTLPFSATHLCENFLAAASIARYFGMSWEAIFNKGSTLTVYPKRFELVTHRGITFVNDAYNANPASMKAALLNLPKADSQGKTLAVLGEMRELGAFAEESHQEVGRAALDSVDQVLCLGEATALIVELFVQAGRPAEHFATLGELKERVYALARPGDVVLLKGSNSLQLWKVLE